MKLTELDPRWLIEGDQRVGFLFRSPSDQLWYQCCMFAPTPRAKQIKLLSLALEDLQARGRVQLSRPDFGWACRPDPALADFASLTLHPSVDGSAGGLWHGWIRNGEVISV